MTIIKGSRHAPMDYNNLIVEKQERKYGDFTMTFNVPHKFEVRGGPGPAWFALLLLLFFSTIGRSSL